MTMISTKRDLKSIDTSAAPCDAGAPLYSYGTSLCLDEELLMKLGMSELPAVGTKFTLNAIVEVTGARSNETKDGTNASLDLQLTEMELGTQGVTNDDRAKKLYPDQA